MPSPLLLLLISEAFAVDRVVGPASEWTTLGAAVEASADGDRILVEPGVYPEALVLDGRVLTIEGTGDRDDVTLVSPGPEGSTVLTVRGGELTLSDLTLDGGGERRALYVEGAAVDLDDLVIRRGLNADGWPGGGVDLYAGASVTAEDLELEENSAVVGLLGLGGHVAVELGSSLTLKDAELTGGVADGGGAVYVDGTSVLVVEESDFVDNVAGAEFEARGGALLGGYGAVLEVRKSSFSGNTAGTSDTSGGGAIAGEGSLVSIEDSELVGNGPTHQGGAVSVQWGELSVVDSRLLANAAQHGGAVEVVGSDATLVRVELCGNVAHGGDPSGPEPGDGGALQAIDSFLVVKSSVLQANEAAGGGGAISLVDGEAELVNLHLIGNVAAGPGGAVLAVPFLGKPRVALINDLIAGNVGSSPAVDLPDAGFTVAFDAWWDNAPGHSSGPTGAGSLVDVPPDLVAPLDGGCGVEGLEPAVGSPLIDAGDLALTDPDGSRSDIGAFGGALAEPSLYEDGDGDGVVALYDCDDLDASAFPGNDETWYDGIDGDCAGGNDYDADGDGFVAEAHGGLDCDDAAAAVHPLADDLPDDGIDGDCDGIEVGTWIAGPMGCRHTGGAGLGWALAALLALRGRGRSRRR